MGKVVKKGILGPVRWIPLIQQGRSYEQTQTQTCREHTTAYCNSAMPSLRSCPLSLSTDEVRDDLQS
eukprot:1082054-Amphidinium_carterae.1